MQIDILRLLKKDYNLKTALLYLIILLVGDAKEYEASTFDNSFFIDNWGLFDNIFLVDW